jgi:hypothetical protein
MSARVVQTVRPKDSPSLPGFERFGLEMSGQGIGHFIQIPFHNAVQAVQGEIDAMIGDPILGKLYVRTRSSRSPDPTWLFRCSDISVCCSSVNLSRRRAENLQCFGLVLVLGFFVLAGHTIPVGIWVTRTAESVVFTLCPPGPEDR